MTFKVCTKPLPKCGRCLKPLPPEKLEDGCLGRKCPKRHRFKINLDNRCEKCTEKEAIKERKRRAKHPSSWGTLGLVWGNKFSAGKPVRRHRQSRESQYGDEDDVGANGGGGTGNDHAAGADDLGYPRLQPRDLPNNGMNAGGQPGFEHTIARNPNYQDPQNPPQPSNGVIQPEVGDPHNTPSGGYNQPAVPNAPPANAPQAQYGPPATMPASPSNEHQYGAEQPNYDGRPTVYRGAALDQRHDWGAPGRRSRRHETEPLPNDHRLPQSHQGPPHINQEDPHGTYAMQSRNPNYSSAPFTLPNPGGPVINQDIPQGAPQERSPRSSRRFGSSGEETSHTSESSTNSYVRNRSTRAHRRPSHYKPHDEPRSRFESYQHPRPYHGSYYDEDGARCTYRSTGWHQSTPNTDHNGNRIPGSERRFYPQSRYDDRYRGDPRYDHERVRRPRISEREYEMRQAEERKRNDWRREHERMKSIWKEKRAKREKERRKRKEREDERRERRERRDRRERQKRKERREDMTRQRIYTEREWKDVVRGQMMKLNGTRQWTWRDDEELDQLWLYHE